MTDTLIGESGYGDLKGVMQTMAPEAGRQFIGWINEVNKGRGYTSVNHLRPNEGRRSQARQLMFWNAYQYYKAHGSPYAALAAVPYTSNHGPGLAVDIGRNDGSVLTQDDLNALHTTCLKWGFKATGLGFSIPELWHFDYVGVPATGERSIAPVGIELHYTDQDAPAPTPPAPKKKVTMRFIIILGIASGTAAPYLYDSEDGKRRRLSALELSVERLAGTPEVGSISPQSAFDGIPKKDGSI